MESSRPELFLDTWAWVALADRRDQWNRAATDVYLRYSRRLHATSDFVLDEAISQLFLRLPFAHARRFVEQIWAAREDGRLTIIPITQGRFAAAWELRLRFRDKPRVSFTDLTSFVVIDEFDIPHVLTGDEHFGQAGLRCKVLPNLLGA
ncbi:MAG: PIN domain-containing protein [Bryobacteraceae bacterium]|nr:PIN domain-containing protein [Bryobacteraceae bacterium]